MGVKTYTREGGNGNVGDHEVAQLDISGGLYVWTSTLNSVGRVESINVRAGLFKRTERFVASAVREGGARFLEMGFGLILVIVLFIWVLSKL